LRQNFAKSAVQRERAWLKGGCIVKRVTIIAAALLVSGTAHAQSIGERTGIDSVLGITPSSQDFVTEVARSDMFEIASSKMAVEKSNGAVKDFASQMVTDHTKTSAQLKTEAQAANIPVPTAIDSSTQSKLDRLANLDGSAFTKEYLDYQVSAHKDAVSLFQRYGKGGDNAQLKSWAVTTLPALQHHLDMAQGLDK
jgi:putative membrane protein